MNPATTSKCAQHITRKLKTDEDHQELTNLSFAVTLLRKNSALKEIHAFTVTHVLKSSTTRTNTGQSFALPL